MKLNKKGAWGVDQRKLHEAKLHESASQSISALLSSTSSSEGAPSPSTMVSEPVGQPSLPTDSAAHLGNIQKALKLLRGGS